MTGEPTSTAIYHAAADELASAMVPMPDDYVEDLSPHAAILLLRQMSMVTAKVALGATVSLQEDDSEPDGALGDVLRGVMGAVAGATHACVALGIFPAEAETELEEAAR